MILSFIIVQLGELRVTHPKTTGTSSKTTKGAMEFFPMTPDAISSLLKKYEEDVETGEMKVSFPLAWNFNQNPGQNYGQWDSTSV